MTGQFQILSRGLKFLALLLLNTLIAVLGPAITESSISMIFRFHPHTVTGVIWKEWILSIALAALYGFFMWKIWKANATKWAWILPALWFGLRFLHAMFVAIHHDQSVLLENGEGSLWSQFSGFACSNGSDFPSCRNFLMFTIVFIRGIFFSAGAWCSSLFYDGNTAAAP